jgi:hypothetical protein
MTDGPHDIQPEQPVEPDELEALMQASCLCTDGLCSACNQVATRLRALDAEAREDATVVLELSALLTGVMEALKVPREGRNFRDAPQLVFYLVSDIDAMRAEIGELRDAIAQAAGADSRTDELEQFMHAADNILRGRR